LTMEQLENGACKPITFIFARATTELGNMGASTGSFVANGLAGKYGVNNVAIQGVNYPAGFMGNFQSGGCAPQGIREAVRLFNLAHSKCPNTIIVAGGYSQGTACIHRSIPQLAPAVVSQIAGVVLYGDTQFKQTGGAIEGLPANKLKIYCNDGDRVCTGTLSITEAHFQYKKDVAPTLVFLENQIAAA
ncbi:carbohydrate esterase family 5 protein, partial [Aulographum hederae CBS 113979]